VRLNEVYCTEYGRLLLRTAVRLSLLGAWFPTGHATSIWLLGRMRETEASILF
jgi:hypothetical protein